MAIRVWKQNKRKRPPDIVLLSIDDDDIPSTDEGEPEAREHDGQVQESISGTPASIISSASSENERSHMRSRNEPNSPCTGRALTFGPSSFTQDPMENDLHRTAQWRARPSPCTPHSASPPSTPDSLVPSSGFCSTWTVGSLEGGMSTLQDNTQNNVIYTLPTCNVSKAKNLLDRSTVAFNVLNASWCRSDRNCSYNCHNNVPIQHILKVRYGKLKHQDHTAQKIYMAGLVNQCECINGRRQLLIEHTPVCVSFWMKALVTCTNTYSDVVKAATSEVMIPGQHGNKGRIRVTEQNLIATAFWRDFFSTCQTADEVVYFWPVATQMEWVFQKKFPKFCKTYFPTKSVPSKSCMVSARRAREFDNIKNRKDHFHIRCYYCSLLGEERRIGFVTREQEEDNARQQAVHDEEVRLWHSAETSLSFKAMHSPGKTQVYKIDDTNALGVPHCSLRLPKSVAKLYKVPFVPCLLHDVNSNKKMYLYSLKGQHKKGGNRFCTTMFHAFKAAKSDPTSQAASARDAIIIGDNYNENRNITNMCFASEVVMAGWYDSITFLYGLLGHTHNGGDRDHRMHNQLVGKHYSNTLVEWIRKFPDGWPRAGTRPGVAFIDHQYDWDAYYKHDKIKVDAMNQRLTSYGGPFLICSFKIQKEPSGHVTVRYRKSCDHTAPFLGKDGTEASPGFIVLRQRPGGIPPRIRPSPIDGHAKILRDLKKPQLHETMAIQNNGNVDSLNRELDWLKRCTTEGIIPVARYPDGEHVIKPGNWGSRADISIHPEREPIIIEYLKPVSTRATKEDFWRVPARALRPEERPARLPIPAYGDEPARLDYASAAHRESNIAALQPLDINQRVPVSCAPDPEDSSDDSLFEPSGSDADEDDDADPYCSPAKEERPHGWRLPRKVGTVVYCVDDGAICKGAIDHFVKGGEYMIKFSGWNLPGSGKPSTVGYLRHELHATRTAAEAALEALQRSSDQSSSEGDLSVANRGYQPSRKNKAALKEKRQKSAERSHIRANARSFA